MDTTTQQIPKKILKVSRSNALENTSAAIMDISNRSTRYKKGLTSPENLLSRYAKLSSDMFCKVFVVTFF